MNQKYVVKLSKSEREQLEKMVACGTGTCAHVDACPDPAEVGRSAAGAKWTYAQICEAFDVTQVTVSKVRKAYAEQGLEAAIQRKKPDREYLPRLDGKAEAHLVALACGEPPDGQARWTLRLLQEQDGGTRDRRERLA